MKKTFLLLFAVAALGACKKKDDSNPAPAPTRTDLLTTKNWRVSAETSTSTVNGKTVTTDEYASSQPCERDNFAKFNTNKTVTFDEGATKCDPSDPQTQSGTWDFNSDQTKLTLADPALGGFALPFDIVELTATTLHVRYTDASSSPASTMDITFTAF